MSSSFYSRTLNRLQWLSRKINWHIVSLVSSLVIIAIAGYVLYNILYDVDWQRVFVAFREMDKITLALAGLAVAGAYFTLTFYDYFALRTIGAKHVPYRVAALSGFSSYAIGHNIGATIVSGGLVRYRIYTAWGLSGGDVVRIIFIAGLTFWLGNAAFLGTGLFFVPSAGTDVIPSIPEIVWQILAVITIFVLIGYVWWVGQKPRTIGYKSVSVRLPGSGLTSVQIVVGFVDLFLCALALYLLLPHDAGNGETVGFYTIAVIFVAALVLGFASHAPGGLGVFDAVLLVALDHLNREELLAGILVYRIIYYLIPLIAAIAAMLVYEFMPSVSRRRRVLQKFRKHREGQNRPSSLKKNHKIFAQRANS